MSHNPNGEHIISYINPYTNTRLDAMMNKES